MRSELIVGDSIDEEVETFDSDGNEYTGDDGWAAKFRFLPRPGGAGTAFDINCSWTGDAFRYQVSAATSAAWVAGDYTWALIVSKTGLRVTLQTGTAVVKPDPNVVASWDGRTQAQKAIDDLKAALATFNATAGRVKSYSIAGRAMEFEAATDIVKLLNFWQGERFREKRAESIATGLGDPSMIYVRF